jgi:hypothetical protein
VIAVVTSWKNLRVYSVVLYDGNLRSASRKDNNIMSQQSRPEVESYHRGGTRRWLAPLACAVIVLLVGSTVVLGVVVHELRSDTRRANRLLSATSVQATTTTSSVQPGQGSGLSQQDVVELRSYLLSVESRLLALEGQFGLDCFSASRGLACVDLSQIQSDIEGLKLDVDFLNSASTGSGTSQFELNQLRSDLQFELDQLGQKVDLLGSDISSICLTLQVADVLVLC